MRPLWCAHFATTAFALPLFFRRSPAPAPRPIAYNVVSVDGHDAESNNSLQNRNPEPIPASYSVVAVDGGPAAFTGGPAPTRTETLLTTHLATITITDSETPTTIVVTVTEPQGSSQPQHTPAPAPPPHAQEETTVEATTVTETVSASPAPDTTQTRPYDNGMWHTTYYYTTVQPTSLSAPGPQPTSDSQAQSTNSESGPWYDVAPNLPGVQVVGGGTQVENTDTDRQAWMEGAWAPWADGAKRSGGNGNGAASS